MEPVKDLLESKGIRYQISGQDFKVVCLNPEHEDRDPSLRIDKTTGAFNCFSCVFKGNIFSYFGLLTNTTWLKVAKLKEKLTVLRSMTTGLEPLEGHTPWTQKFRGISKETLRHFEAFYTNRVEKMQDRIVFPLKDVSGKTVLFIGRHILSDANPRYEIYPKNTTIPLYPVRFDQAYTSAVLVEGIFDLLNIYDKGLKNVCCTFGTGTLKKNTAAKLLPLKAQGITKIYLMFDADKAGEDAMKELKPLIEDTGMTVEIIRLQEDMDPGELSTDDVHSITEYINAKDSNSRQESE